MASCFPWSQVCDEGEHCGVGMLAEQTSYFTAWWLGRSGAEERQAQDKVVFMGMPPGTYFLPLGSPKFLPPPNNAVKSWINWWISPGDYVRALKTPLPFNIGFSSWGPNLQHMRLFFFSFLVAEGYFLSKPLQCPISRPKDPLRCPQSLVAINAV